VGIAIAAWPGHCTVTVAENGSPAPGPVASVRATTKNARAVPAGVPGTRSRTTSRLIPATQWADPSAGGVSRHVTAVPFESVHIWLTLASAEPPGAVAVETTSGAVSPVGVSQLVVST